MHSYIKVMTRDAAHKYPFARTEPETNKPHTTQVTIRANIHTTGENEESRASKKTGHVQWWISLSRGPPAHTRRVPISVWYNTLTPKKQTRVPLSSVTAAPADSTPAHSQRKKIRKRT
ncbi:hypothetical protein V502_05118 [Pseudogymnoascus sp. VKM F-4520 (FW-2644)]|nr:hypothetical protein V502_05118 [Pseudogymnoascus sp. VKM F-4520 (FW-2644)]